MGRTEPVVRPTTYLVDGIVFAGKGKEKIRDFTPQDTASSWLLLELVNHEVMKALKKHRL
jgi:hypothetical protein